MAHRLAPSRNFSEFSTMQLRLCSMLHQLPVQQWITYKLAVLTYKVRSTSTPVYVPCRITEHVCSQTLHSAAIPLLVQLFTRTHFFMRTFQHSAPSVWNSLPATVGLAFRQTNRPTSPLVWLHMIAS